MARTAANGSLDVYTITQMVKKLVECGAWSVEALSQELHCDPALLRRCLDQKQRVSVKAIRQMEDLQLARIYCATRFPVY